MESTVYKLPWTITLFLLIVTMTPFLSGECYTNMCHKNKKHKTTVINLTPFNEAQYWLEINEHTGKPQICSKRIFPGSEYGFDLQPEICFATYKIHNPSKHLPQDAQCYYADGIRNGLILCVHKDGSLKLYTNAQSHCSDILPRKRSVGSIKHKRRGRCTITMDQTSNKNSAEKLPSRSTRVHTTTGINIKRVQNPSARTNIWNLGTGVTT